MQNSEAKEAYEVTQKECVQKLSYLEERCLSFERELAKSVDALAWERQKLQETRSHANQLLELKEELIGGANIPRDGHPSYQACSRCMAYSIKADARYEARQHELKSRLQEAESRVWQLGNEVQVSLSQFLSRDVLDGYSGHVNTQYEPLRLGTHQCRQPQSRDKIPEKNQQVCFLCGERIAGAEQDRLSDAKTAAVENPATEIQARAGHTHEEVSMCFGPVESSAIESQARTCHTNQKVPLCAGPMESSATELQAWAGHTSEKIALWAEPVRTLATGSQPWTGHTYGDSSIYVGPVDDSATNSQAKTDHTDDKASSKDAGMLSSSAVAVAPLTSSGPTQSEQPNQTEQTPEIATKLWTDPELEKGEDLAQDSLELTAATMLPSELGQKSFDGSDPGRSTIDSDSPRSKNHCWTQSAPRHLSLSDRISPPKSITTARILPMQVVDDSPSVFSKADEGDMDQRNNDNETPSNQHKQTNEQDRVNAARRRWSKVRTWAGTQVKNSIQIAFDAEAVFVY